LGQRTQLPVECSPVELAWLEILVGFYAIDRFAQFVEIADSLAVAIRTTFLSERIKRSKRYGELKMPDPVLSADFCIEVLGNSRHPVLLQ
jgi:hypothetical protein